MQTELNEAKFKLPTGTKMLSKEVTKIGSTKIDIVYVQTKKNTVDVYVDGSKFNGDASYKDLKSAQAEFKDIKQVMRQMSEEGISIGEIINEINS